MPISEAVFQKHVYGRQRKRELKPTEDFDPRPIELCGKSNEHLKTLLGKVRGQGLGISLLFDEECRCWSTTTEQPLTPVLPTKEQLRERVEEFKKSLRMPPHQLREIEQSTREQSRSSLWYSVRRYRITAVVKPAVQNTYKRCRSRKCIRWHIPVHAIFAVFYLIFLPVLSRPSFTSRTPNKDQKTEQLFYFKLVQVL